MSGAKRRSDTAPIASSSFGFGPFKGWPFAFLSTRAACALSRPTCGEIIDGGKPDGTEAYVGHGGWREQLKGIRRHLLATTDAALMAVLLQHVLSLRPTIEAETEGLDLNNHGEEAYIFDAKS